MKYESALRQIESVTGENNKLKASNETYAFQIQNFNAKIEAL
jgi:hypothetical protein